jgi:DNA end-binding protein Ku
MALRPLWKGYLKLSLVSCPIALYPAISAAERVSFRQVNRRTGNRLRHQLVDAVTNVPIESHEKGRGYEIGENQFVIVEDEDLAAARQQARSGTESTPAHSGPVEQLKDERSLTRERRDDQKKVDRETAAVAPPPRPRIENTHTIAVEHFIPRAQMDPRYYDTPYYIVPRDEMASEAFAVIREAMAMTQYVGMGHVVLSNRERPIIVAPMGKGLLGMTLHYTHEVRSEADYFAHIPELTLPKEMLGVAERILEAMKADFDPAHLQDRYRSALINMLQDKQRKVPKAAPRAVPSRDNVVNLMDVLRRSLAAERPGGQASGKKSRGAVVSRKSGATKRLRPNSRRAQGA